MASYNSSLGNSTECAILLAGFASVVTVCTMPVTKLPVLDIQKLFLFGSTTCINIMLKSNTDSIGGMLFAVGTGGCWISQREIKS